MIGTDQINIFQRTVHADLLCQLSDMFRIEYYRICDKLRITIIMFGIMESQFLGFDHQMDCFCAVRTVLCQIKMIKDRHFLQMFDTK